MQRRGENINSPHHPVEDSFSAQERGLWITSSACFRTPGRWAIVCVCVCVCLGQGMGTACWRDDA